MPAILIRLLRFAFHLLYHPLAWTYDWVAAAVSVGMWQRWVLTVLPEITGSCVLELGPGPGHLLKRLRENPDVSAWGLERSRQMRRIGYQRLRRAGLTPGLIAGDARKLPFKNGVFDTVVATFPAEYIGEAVSWQEAARTLKIGGQFIVLLGAQLQGGGILHRAAATLFRITGQSGAFDENLIFSRLEAALDGPVFKTKVLKKPARNSQVLIVVAEKTGAA